MNREGPTYLACLTPAGRGAIATLAIRGPRSWEIVRPLFHRPLPAQPERGRFWLGWLGENRAAADQVVLAVQGSEPEPWVEIHCHGGPEVLRLLEETLTARGAQVCTWDKLLQNSAANPLQGLASIALAEAATVRTAAILLDQYHGALERALRQVVSALEQNCLAPALAILDELARFSPLGGHLTRPWRVVIAGPANVGKSSLVNALAGFQRSVVAPTPGTTRDVVTAHLAIDGWPVEIADTAGWHATADELEQEGLRRARAAAAEADLRLWVMNAAAAPLAPPSDGLAWQLLINKIDLPAAWDLDAVTGALRICAVSGAGVTDLCQAISSWLVPAVPPAGAAVPFTPALANLIEQFRGHCQAGTVQAALQLLDDWAPKKT